MEKRSIQRLSDLLTAREHTAEYTTFDLKEYLPNAELLRLAPTVASWIFFKLVNGGARVRLAKRTTVEGEAGLTAQDTLISVHTLLATRAYKQEM
eukprot:8912130-Lingulodinium_polyedra.AAC.1